MKPLKIILVLGHVALTYLLGATFFYQNSLSYENGRHFNEAKLTVYHEQAISVYFLFFILALIMTALAAYSLIRAKS